MQETAYKVEGNELIQEKVEQSWPLHNIIQKMVHHMRQQYNTEGEKYLERMYTRKGYLRECRTIHVGGGRRWGHTTAALSVVGRGSTMYLAFTNTQCNDASRTLRTLFPDHESPLCAGAFYDGYLSPNLQDKTGFECILVDSAAVLLGTKEATDSLYAAAATILRPDGFLLLVG